jgi:hypothetical protein
MKRTVLFLVALLVLALMPTVASAATEAEELAAIAVFGEALDDLETCVTPEGCAEDLVELEAALLVMKEVFPCISFIGIDLAIEELAAAILIGDQDLIDVAVAVVLVEGLELIDAAIGSDCDVAAPTTTIAAPTTTIAATTTVAPTTTVAGATTTIAEVVTDIPDGGSGPNVALLGMAALLVLLASGAFVLRLTADRR